MAAGHEIGMHGYTHENPIAMTAEQEEAVMRKCVDLIEKVSGRRPTGYVAPWWEFSTITNELLLKLGIKYDHSLMHNDFTPYYVRVGDTWTLIDYSKKAEEWMVPLERGHETDLVEIPASWHLDDLPPMMFIKKSPNSHGFVNPRDIEQIWMDQFDWVYREMDYAVFTMTVHPDVSGRPGRADDARADHRAHQQARRRALVHVRRARRRLRQALAAGEVGRGYAPGFDCLVDDLRGERCVGRVGLLERGVREAVDAGDEDHRARHPRGHALRVVGGARRHLAERLAALLRARVRAATTPSSMGCTGSSWRCTYSTPTPRAAPRSRAKADDLPSRSSACSVRRRAQVERHADAAGDDVDQAGCTSISPTVPTTPPPSSLASRSSSTIVSAAGTAASRRKPIGVAPAWSARPWKCRSPWM